MGLGFSTERLAGQPQPRPPAQAAADRDAFKPLTRS